MTSIGCRSVDELKLSGEPALGDMAGCEDYNQIELVDRICVYLPLLQTVGHCTSFAGWAAGLEEVGMDAAVVAM
jgi:hypothetical protein